MARFAITRNMTVNFKPTQRNKYSKPLFKNNQRGLALLVFLDVYFQILSHRKMKTKTTYNDGINNFTLLKAYILDYRHMEYTGLCDNLEIFQGRCFKHS